MAVTTDTVSGLRCHDWRGHVVEEGTQYVPDKGDPCMTCTCERGFPVTCRSVLCSPPACAHYEAVQGECCRFLCFDPPPDNTTLATDTHIPGGGDMAHLGLRLVAATVTSFLVLALLLYMVHRLRQRRSLIMTRRLEAERQEEDPAYMTHLDNLHIEFPPYEDPPPPYSPPKPPDIPQGEAPPPYMEHEHSSLTSRHQLIPYATHHGVANGDTGTNGGVSNGSSSGGGGLSNGGLTRNGGSNVSNGSTPRDCAATDAPRPRPVSTCNLNGEAHSGGSVGRCAGRGSNSRSNRPSRNNSRSGGTHRRTNSGGSMSRPRSITQSIGTNTGHDLDAAGTEAGTETIVHMHNNSARTSLYRTDSRTEGGEAGSSRTEAEAAPSHNSSSSLTPQRNLFLKRSGSIEIKCSNSSPRISFYLDEDSRSDMEAGNNRAGASDDRMTQSCMEPCTSGDSRGGGVAVGVLRGREPVCSSSPLLPVSPSLSSICSETGEARGEAAAHAGIARYPVLPNDASAYPELRPTPRTHHAPTAHSSSRGGAARDHVSSSSSSSSPSSSGASQEHRHRPPRRLIYRDPDFDLDSSSCSPPASHAPAARAPTPPPPPRTAPSPPPPDPDAAVRRERIRRRESPETYRRLSQAWDAAAQYKQYGFIDPPTDHTPPPQHMPPQHLMELPAEKSRSLSKERKRSKSKERRRQRSVERGSGEKPARGEGSGEKPARGEGGATCPHGRQRRGRHQRSRSGDSSADRTPRRHRTHRHSSRHSASFDTATSPPATSEGVMSRDSATAGVSQATQVETTYLNAQHNDNTAPPPAAEEEDDINAYTTSARARDASIRAETASNTLTASQGRERAGGDNISRNNSRGKADGSHTGGHKENKDNEKSETEDCARHRTDDYHNPLSSSSS